MKDNITKIRGLYDRFSWIIEPSPGASHNHHAWPGGYLCHIKDCLNIAKGMFEAVGDLYIPPFDLKDAVEVLLMHDIEKPFRYSEDGGEFAEKNAFPLDTKENRHDFRLWIAREHGIVFSSEQQNALKYVEGEFDYSPKERKMGELAAFCHACDVVSARMMYDNRRNRKLTVEKVFESVYAAINL